LIKVKVHTFIVFTEELLTRSILKKFNGAALFVGVGLLLSACGGGSGGADTAASSLTSTSPGASISPTSSTTTAPSSGSTTTTPPASNVTQTIDYYGDSTIWGYASGNGYQVATPAPLAFSQALPASPKYVVRNEGVSSTDSCQLLNGTDGKHPAWDQQMTNTPASIVIISYGINDEWRYDVNTFKGCLQSLAQKAKAKGKKVIFETTNPTRDSGPNGLDVYVNAMKAVAVQENVPVIDQYKYLTDYLQGRSVTTICPDGLHPTDAVYIMKGKYAASVFPTLPL